MDADALFSVFDEEPEPTGNKSGKRRKLNTQKEPKHKRFAEHTEPPAPPSTSTYASDPVAGTSTATTTTATPPVMDSPSSTAMQVDTSAAADRETPVAAKIDDEDDEKSTVTFPGLAASRESCTHEVALPPGWTGPNPLEVPAPVRKPAKEYPFVLDPFQAEAVKALEKGESVLVSAHTSAGKTAVAEYAIAMSLRDNQRVIYTSPIKALSNQKYRELNDQFQDVGLMTGDVTISPNASCVVMTTEILRSMLYRGSEMLREVAWVVFDEIHYMRDRERGVVWEETIILLPDKIRYVFLSATIPNALEFAQWIAQLHNQVVHVVYTDYRPTPLQHYMFPMASDGIHLVVDEKGKFRENNFQKVLTTLASRSADREKVSANISKKKGNRGTSNTLSDVKKIVKMIMERHYEPVIVFSFAKRECEGYALQMSKLDFNTEEEKQLVQEVYTNAIDSLSDDDKKLPQVEHILPLLKRGIGIHHSGLLPLLKEVIEILFQEGLIKCLFSTETFSLGLNMPARTVVFTSIRKWDGTDFRWITSGEYIQMSGRAGRRGLDDRGIVIAMVDDQIDPQVVKNMIGGKADPLNSTFHLGYSMLLNLLRVEEVNAEYMMERSFHNFQHQRQLPALEEQLKQLEAQRQAIRIPDEDKVADYYHLRKELARLREEARREIVKPIHILPFIQPGRLVKVFTGEAPPGLNEERSEWGWGVVVNFTKKRADGPDPAKETNPANVIVDVLLECEKQPGSDKDGGRIAKPQPPKPGQKGEMMVIPVQLDMISAISSLRAYLPSDLRQRDHRMSVLISLNEIKKRFSGSNGSSNKQGGDGGSRKRKKAGSETKGSTSSEKNDDQILLGDAIPLLDPVSDMQITNSSFKKLLRKIETLENRMASNPLQRQYLEQRRSGKSPAENTVEQLFLQFAAREALDDDIKEMRKRIKSVGHLVLTDNLKAMMRVLRRLDFCNEDNVIKIKGRIGAEISAGDELLLTEMLFNGVFNDLSAPQTVALLSCLVFDEKSNDKTQLRPELQTVYRQLQETARRIAKVSQESKIEIDVEEYVQSFPSSMMEVAYCWTKGSKFADICKMTDIFEGSIIRAMRRLEELLRQMCIAAKTIGDDTLEKKFLDCINTIKRDIIFSSSLYL